MFYILKDINIEFEFNKLTGVIVFKLIEVA